MSSPVPPSDEPEPVAPQPGPSPLDEPRSDVAGTGASASAAALSDALEPDTAEPDATSPSAAVTEAGESADAPGDADVAGSTAAAPTTDRVARRAAASAAVPPPRRRLLRRRGVAIAAFSVVMVLLGGASFALGAATATPVAAETVATASATPTPDPRPTADAAGATKVRTCSVAEAAADPRLATLQARVVDADTGEVLFDRNGDNPARTASNLKVVTSAAALAVFGPDHTITTRVVAGSEPGTIVLIGSGDLTLTRLPTGQESVYQGAAHLDDLAAQVASAWAASGHTEAITRIVLDTSLYGGETWLPAWDTKGMAEGYQAHVTALQVDGDRDLPSEQNSSRSSDPVARAGAAFAAYFPGAATEIGTAPAGTTELGSVESPPISSLISYSILESDNMVAEMLARLLAIEVGTGNTFEAEDAAIHEALETYGIDTSGIHVVDGSGLSADNAVPNSYFTSLFVQIHQGEGELWPILDGLPVAGQTGTLGYSDRFTGDAAIAVGHVHAKTGWIQSAFTLSGLIDAADGSTLAFSIYALGDAPMPSTTKEGIDLLTAAFYRCGDDLSDY